MNISKQSPLLIVILNLVTAGIYRIYWHYCQTLELREDGNGELSPGLEALISVITCGLFTIYVSMRNAKLIHEHRIQLGTTAENRSEMVLVFGLLSLVVPGAMFVADFILCEEQNKLADESNLALTTF